MDYPHRDHKFVHQDQLESAHLQSIFHVFAEAKDLKPHVPNGKEKKTNQNDIT
jgi:hypothetical protein